MQPTEASGYDWQDEIDNVIVQFRRSNVGCVECGYVSCAGRDITGLDDGVKGQNNRGYRQIKDIIEDNSEDRKRSRRISKFFEPVVVKIGGGGIDRMIDRRKLCGTEEQHQE